MLASHLSRLVAIDAEALGGGWRVHEVSLDRPGKWEVSRVGIARAGRPVGFAVASIKPTGIHVHRLAVETASRGRGLGRALLASVAADGAARGISILTLKVAPSNEEARHFYRRLGFRESALDARNVALETETSRLLAVDS